MMLEDTTLMYCVIRHPLVDLDIFQGITGVEGRKLEFIAYRDLLAVVSAISSENQSPALSQLCAYENAIASLQSHAAIDSVIPVRYGSFFHRRRLIIELLKDQFPIYDRLLIELNGCVEMGIRLRMVTAESPPSPPLIKKDVSSGKSYLESIRSRLAGEELIPEAIQNYTQTFCRAFTGLFEKFKLECPKHSKIGRDNNFPSLYFLVKKKNVEKIQAIFELTTSAMPEEEKMQIYLNGPWPPYNFVF